MEIELVIRRQVSRQSIALVLTIKHYTKEKNVHHKIKQLTQRK